MRTQKVVDSKCPNCGAKLDFDAKTQKWKCKYCESTFTLEEIETKVNAAAAENNEKTTTTKQPKKEKINYNKYNCQNCGAEIICDEQTSATFCVYCGNTAILKDKLTDEFSPNWIIPFKKEVNDAKEAFKGLSKGRPLCPKEFTNENNIEKIRGVYIPFWLFDMQASGELQCHGTNIRTWVVGDESFTETKEYKLEREGSMTFKRIPKDGSTRFDDNIMDSIEPFNYDELVEYNHAYLSGFLAEKYDVEATEAVKSASERAMQTATNIMSSDMTMCTTKRVISNTITAKETKKEYVLLPVYMVNVKFNGKMHTFAMNGQTGEFIGDIPVDKKKAWIYALSIFGGVFLTIMLISYIAYLL